ncbi:MAG: serine/threonine-protein kinase, partial [Terriglobales bacterium]
MAEFQGTSRFEIIRRLGAGGMGVVYEALDRERQQHVALKMLPHTDADTLYRFKREFRSLAGLLHPNLISLYELVGEAGEPWFFTMELVAGGADFLHFVGRVRSEVKSPAGWDDTPTATTGMLEAPTLVDTGASHTAPATPVSAAAALDAGALLRLRGALAQMAEGVQALHHAGKLHRDLKPANVMVRADGRLLLLDFGLVLEREEASSGAGAKIVPGAVPESYFSSTVAGTIPFMSPEQAAGAALTPARDWYAVGVMLFEALTGRQPFIGTAREVLERKQHN